MSISKELGEKLEKLEHNAAESPKQLVIWPEPYRAAPNEIFRSNLFNARYKGQREQFIDENLFVIGDGEMTYRGEELRTDDEDVWLQVMHLIKIQALGEWVEFSPYAFIRALGWVSYGKKSKKIIRPSHNHYLRLRTNLSRMQATTLTFKAKRIGVGQTVSLIRKFEWEGLKRWRVWIEPEMKVLYGDKNYTRIEWEQRVQLTPTAKKLHCYFASHRNPYKIKVETLHGLCKSKSTLSVFASRICGYLDELVYVGFAIDYEVYKGLVDLRRS